MGRHAVIAFAVLVVTASIGVRERRIERAYAEVTSVDRVDMGIDLRIVRKAPRDGDELIPGLPRMRLVDNVHLGGMVVIDRDGARLEGPSLAPVVWHASEQQADLILHDDSRPIWSLIQGSEGSNKTATLARWLARMAIEYIGQDVEIGCTGPTDGRLEHVKREIRKWWSPSWAWFHTAKKLYQFHAGPRIQLVSAVVRSKAGGSPIQGANWVACASDELQDHFEREDDILARGRSAPRGQYKRICSSTPKDSSEWRTFRESAARPPADKSKSRWAFDVMLGMDSPFVFDEHWLNMRSSGTMTEREWRRRVLAQDVGPERQVYFNWRRTYDNGAPANLRAIPEGARDVTAQMLAPWATNAAVLIGHDPGQRQQVSVFLKAFLLPGQARGDERPRWFVIDEITSPESTIHAHAQQVLKRLRDRWHCHGFDRLGQADPSSPVALVRIDPHTRGGGDEHPGSDVATIWKGLGMVARAAGYKTSGRTVEPITIKRRQRIDLINTLMSHTAAVGDVRRLFVAIRSGFLWPAEEQDGKPAAPCLVRAFETMEFNAAGRAEEEAKDADDLSHWPAATGYALWQVEAPRLGMDRAA